MCAPADLQHPVGLDTATPATAKGPLSARDLTRRDDREPEVLTCSLRLSLFAPLLSLAAESALAAGRVLSCGTSHAWSPSSRASAPNLRQGAGGSRSADARRGPRSLGLPCELARLPGAAPLCSARRCPRGRSVSRKSLADVRASERGCGVCALRVCLYACV